MDREKLNYIDKFQSAHPQESVTLTSDKENVKLEPPCDPPTTNHWPQILACTSAASFHMQTGAILAFSAICIPQLKALDSEISVTNDDISWIASIVPLVMPVGALGVGYLVDEIGRLNTIKSGCIPNLLGWICIATAQNLSMLLFGRLLTGLSMALTSSPALVYIPEVAAPELRGSCSSLGSAFVSFGLIAVYAMGAFLHWRTVAWLSVIICLVPLVLTIIWSSESPVWLVSKGKNQEALKSLKFLLRREKKEGKADHHLQKLIEEQKSKQYQANQKGSPLGKLLRGLTKPNGFKPLLLLVAIFFFQQFSGIYITIFYAVTLFQAVGATINPYVSSVGIGIVRLLFGCLTTILMKHFGRRPLFIISGAGMAFFIFIAGYITKEVEAGNMKSSFVPAACILIYMSLAIIGLITLPWTMTAELFPIEFRGMGQGLVISLAHILMFAALKIFPFLTDSLGSIYLVLWLFAGISLSAVIFVFIFLPETHRKTLAEIQFYFKHNTVYIVSKEKTAMSNEVDEFREGMCKINRHPV